MRRLSSWLGRLTLVVLPVLVVVGCSNSDAGSRVSGSLVRVSEKDFRIVVTPNHIPAGEAELVVRNEGPDTHELIIVRSHRFRLPIRLDGLTVDEDVVRAVATVEGVPPERVGRVRVRLAPGRYELFCNMAGHFMAGMHSELVVG